MIWDPASIGAFAALLGALGVVIGALAQLVAAFRALHVQLNARMDELVAANRAAGHAQGVADEQAKSALPPVNPAA